MLVQKIQFVLKSTTSLAATAAVVKIDSTSLTAGVFSELWRENMNAVGGQDVTDLPGGLAQYTNTATGMFGLCFLWTANTPIDIGEISFVVSANDSAIKILTMMVFDGDAWHIQEPVYWSGTKTVSIFDTYRVEPASTKQFGLCEVPTKVCIPVLDIYGNETYGVVQLVYMPDEDSLVQEPLRYEANAAPGAPAMFMDIAVGRYSATATPARGILGTPATLILLVEEMI